MTMLTENFSLASMVRSDTATRLKLNNNPNAKQLANLKELCTVILQPLRNELNRPIIVTSGFRGRALNKEVKGVSTSAHCYGYAADIKCPSYERGDVKKFCIYIRDFLKRKKIKFDQLIFEHIGGSMWVHIGIRNGDGKQRMEVLTIRGRHTSDGIV